MSCNRQHAAAAVCSIIEEVTGEKVSQTDWHNLVALAKSRGYQSGRNRVDVGNTLYDLRDLAAAEGSPESATKALEGMGWKETPGGLMELTPRDGDKLPVYTRNMAGVVRMLTRDGVRASLNEARGVEAAPSPAPDGPPVFDSLDDYDAQVAAWEATGMTTSDAQATVDAYHLKADEYEKKASQHYKDKQDSWDRSDTDGFMSQWASGLSGDKDRIDAQIARQGGVDEFPILMKDGKIVPSKIITTHPAWNYGRPSSTWAVFATAEDANNRGDIIEWVGMTDKAQAKKGYTQGSQIRPARAELKGETAVNVRAVVIPDDGMGFNPDAPMLRSE